MNAEYGRLRREAIYAILDALFITSTLVLAGFWLVKGHERDAVILAAVSYHAVPWRREL